MKKIYYTLVLCLLIPALSQAGSSNSEISTIQPQLSKKQYQCEATCAYKKSVKVSLQISGSDPKELEKNKKVQDDLKKQCADKSSKDVGMRDDRIENVVCKSI